MDSGAMYALTQLQAEVERLQRDMAFIRESYGVVRRAMGIFYDVGRQDRDAETPGRRGKHRHLKSLNLRGRPGDVICAAWTSDMPWRGICLNFPRERMPCVWRPDP